MTITLPYMSSEHVPVLPAELLLYSEAGAGEVAVDCTFGAGGHARLLAERLGEAGTLICIDRDPAAIERYEEFAAEAQCETRFVRADYASALAELAAEGVRADLIYMDLGVSSMQIDNLERGFSYSFDAPLDMRMDTSGGTTAEEVLNEWPESRLADAIRHYGDERHARSIASQIVARRPLQTTCELVEAVRQGVPPAVRFGRGNPAKRTFQAIRIAVNGELDQLDDGLPLAWQLLAPGGRLAAICFHSLEDRRVKRFIAGLERGCVCPPEFPICTCGRSPEAERLTRAVAATAEEIEENPRAGSAHLRVARKLSANGGDS